MRIRRRPGGPAVDSPDAGTMRRAAFRTRLTRTLLVVSAVALLALAAASARGLDAGSAGGLPESNGVVVIDLSLSIGADDYRDIRSTLRRLIAAGGSLGLVMFSDLPYEMLPPGTPASELEPLLRLLVPRERTDDDPGMPTNPWSQSFSAGTRISSALELARDMLVADGIQNGAILLLSDLVTAPEDIPRLARTLQRLEEESISVKVVPLNALEDSRKIFEGLLGEGVFIPPERVASSEPLPSEAPSRAPVWLFVLGALLLVVLAANEPLGGRLGLPRTEGRAA